MAVNLHTAEVLEQNKMAFIEVKNLFQFYPTQSKLNHEANHYSL